MLINSGMGEPKETARKKSRLVAIVGRPNVGKSSLFNKITGRRTAIVEDSPGVTRDRLYGQAEWNGREFTLIDTGGLEPDTKDLILSKMLAQAQVAILSADVIIMVVDIRTGLTATDKDIARILLKSGKPLLLCVNKCDNIGDTPPDFYEFYNLGLGEPYPVSSVHGHGTGDLLDAVAAMLPEKTPIENERDENDSEITAVAIIGKPNAGKSSLINKIAGEERAIVSDIAGTTRDALDTVITRNGEKFLLIDTAGLRRKARVTENIEHYSVIRALNAVDRSDVAVIMIDAEVGFTEQDSKIAGYAHDNGKASVIAVNKWDLIEKDDKTMSIFRKKLAVDFSFMSYAPYVFISAETGQRIDKLFELIKTTLTQNTTRISTGRLNDMLAYATSRVQPPTDRGKRLKLYYITQADTKPPTFVVFCNKIDLFHFSYQRYIENQIREAFGLDMTPIKIIPRERGDGS
ncbi:MAG: ribosome biogenesis GTPase Der [Oscillospiraceae bacterium]|nr:ribosome biogenesis GTPase Der [Oscillospiraceae bacterium]